jgi:hypothetical protein
MHALIVYESMYGNTRAVAEAVADGIGPGWTTTVRAVHEAGAVPDDVDLLVVGGPTHMHGLSTALSRRMAAAAAKEDAAKLAPGATEEPGLRAWLRDLAIRPGSSAAAFDTRGDARAAITGSAARGIARRLRHHGYGWSGPKASWYPTRRDRSRRASSSAHVPGQLLSSRRAFPPTEPNGRTVVRVHRRLARSSVGAVGRRAAGCCGSPR